MKRLLGMLAFFALLFAMREISSGDWKNTHPLRILSLPVTVTWRAAIDGSPVAQLHNNSTHEMTVNIRQTRFMSAQLQSQTVVLSSGEMKEEGWLEGWKFQSGDYIIISNNSWSAFYDPVIVSVN